MKATVAMLALALGLAVPAWAGTIEVVDPWVRAVPPTISMSAAYMTVKNTGDKSVTLVGAATPAFAMVELHQTVTKNGMTGMEPRPAVEIAAKGELVMKPGDYHLMLMQPAIPVVAGQTVPLKLMFKGGEMVEVQAPVRIVAEESPASASHAGHAMPAMPAQHQGH